MMKWNSVIDIDTCNVWFTADLHLFHSNIIWMNKRPFTDSKEMYDYFLNEWNSKVNDSDYVFVLGDFLWGSQSTRLKSLSEALKGNICLILGNHDIEKTMDGKVGSNFDYFHYVNRQCLITMKSEKDNTKQQIFMSHYPTISWPGKSNGSIHLHGHVHGMLDTLNEESSDLRVDVGVDGKLANMHLLHINDIMSYFYNKTNNVPFRQHVMNSYNKKDTDTVL